MLDLVPASTMVLNHPASIRDANEKMVALRFPRFGSQNAGDPRSFPVLCNGLKRIWKSGAETVGWKRWPRYHGVSKGDGNLRSMLEVLTDGEQVHILVQEHIPEISKGDKRIILIDGEAVGMDERVPKAWGSPWEYACGCFGGTV